MLALFVIIVFLSIILVFGVIATMPTSNEPIKSRDDFSVRITPSSYKNFRLWYRWKDKGWSEAVAWFNTKTQEIVLSQNGDAVNVFLRIKPKDIQGFWQLETTGNKQFHYSKFDYSSEIWIDFQENQYWRVLMLIISDSDLEIFRGAFNNLLADQAKIERFEANIPHKPKFIECHEAQQRITGEWQLFEARQLYLSPLYLTILDTSEHTLLILPLSHISYIEALPRLDDERSGILRFQADDEQFCFALKDYEEAANDLALAISKAQEIPIEAEILELKKKEDED